MMQEVVGEHGGYLHGRGRIQCFKLRPSRCGHIIVISIIVPVTNRNPDHDHLKEKEWSLSGPKKVEEPRSLSALETEAKPNMNNSAGGLLGLAYTSSDDEE
ncbi:hypothetical protein Lalb_Chr24g0398631 [Lupinus albus]|uniref:Uncharacterized protein n=1 Tax=Lupinus albus TaxID=3870 RepID=A0A6A4NBR2_LUPAL|nr:hypothetical protein Lalb_Chr24g0398631 [Lupinus albus]